MNPLFDGGHHWIPQKVRDALASQLSPEAYSYWKKSLTGRNQKVSRHGNGTYGNVTHPNYNEEVLKETRKYINDLKTKNKLTNNRLSLRQAEEWLARIKKDGAGNKQIWKFNQGVLKHLKLASLAGFILGNMPIEFAKGAEVVANSKNYKKAIEALRDGDVAKADDYMVNKINSLYIDLLAEGYKKSALHLEKWWPEVRNRALRGEFLDPEDL